MSRQNVIGHRLGRTGCVAARIGTLSPRVCRTIGSLLTVETVDNHTWLGAANLFVSSVGMSQVFCAKCGFPVLTEIWWRLSSLQFHSEREKKCISKPQRQKSPPCWPQDSGGNAYTGMVATQYNNVIAQPRTMPSMFSTSLSLMRQSEVNVSTGVWYVHKIMPLVHCRQQGVCIIPSESWLVGRDTSVFLFASLSSTSEVPSSTIRLERSHTSAGCYNTDALTAPLSGGINRTRSGKRRMSETANLFLHTLT